MRVCVYGGVRAYVWKYVRACVRTRLSRKQLNFNINENVIRLITFLINEIITSHNDKFNYYINLCANYLPYFKYSSGKAILIVLKISSTTK